MRQTQKLYNRKKHFQIMMGSVFQCDNKVDNY